MRRLRKQERYHDWHKTIIDSRHDQVIFVS